MSMRLATAAGPLLLTAFMFGLSTTSAHAYLDAGTGSMIFQVLLGGVAGLALVGKLYWHRLLTTLGLRKELEPDDADSSSARSETPADR